MGRRESDGDVTQCSLYGRDFAARLAGRSLPELAGQAKDQYKQLDASPNFQKLVVKTDTAKAFQDAQKAANDGKLVLYVTPDHIQVGVPATQMPMSGAWGMAVPVVSQAGTGLSASQAKRLKLTEGESVHEHIPLSDGFTTSAKDEMKIFIYDPK